MRAFAPGDRAILTSLDMPCQVERVEADGRVLVSLSASWTHLAFPDELRVDDAADVLLELVGGRFVSRLVTPELVAA